MDKTHHKAIKKGLKTWRRYSAFCLNANANWRANLRNANLCNADLWNANLCNADLRNANLCNANLCNADLCNANLCNADLCNADLWNANLCNANLCNADLRNANLCNANLCNADLSDLQKAQLSIAPECGGYIGWKKCKNDVIVKLLIPANAKRSNATSRKCRAEYVEVLDVVGAEHGVSTHDGKTVYRIGETVHCHEWDDDRWNECSGGIHHFITRIEAENY